MTTRGRRPPSSTPQPSGHTLDLVKGPLAGIGLLLVAGAAGYYLIFAAFDTPMRIMLAAGILLVGIAIAIDPGAVLGGATTHNARYGGNTLAVAAIGLAILALINVLGARRHERWDLTATQQFSLSDETAKILQRIPQPIQTTAFFSFDDTRRAEFGDLLREYQIRSDGQLTFEFVDPVERPALTQQFGIRENGTTILQMGDRRQQLTGTRESDLTTAILRLVEPRAKKAYFTTGHNEHRLDQTNPDGYSQLKSSMESDNFVVESLNLFATNEVPADASLVVVGGPKLPFSDEERDALTTYLERGGKLLLLADPRVEANLSPILAPWNLEVGQSYVVETDPQSAFGSPFGPVETNFPVHKITEQLPLVLFQATTYVNVPRDTPQGATMTSLAQTTERSWAEMDEAALRDPQALRFDEGVDVRGPLTLAVAVETRPASAPGAEPDPTTPKTRLFIAGTSQLVTNQWFVRSPGNRDLFLNAANWLAEAEELISIRAKPTDNRTLFLTSAQQNTILYSTVIFLPLIVLAAGAAVWWSRR